VPLLELPSVASLLNNLPHLLLQVNRNFYF
jgi:hypothetical protein